MLNNMFQILLFIIHNLYCIYIYSIHIIIHYPIDSYTLSSPIHIKQLKLTQALLGIHTKLIKYISCNNLNSLKYHKTANDAKTLFREKQTQ